METTPHPNPEAIDPKLHAQRERAEALANSWDNPETGPTKEIEPKADPPRIYVASLSDYNNGHLHGRWIELGPEVELDDVWHQIREMLAESPEPGAEEFAIHDYEGFGDWRVDEYESIPNVQRAAAHIVEHGLAFAAWLDRFNISLYQEDPEELSDLFNMKYVGEFDSAEDWAKELVTSLVGHDTISTGDTWIDQYMTIDFDAMAQDMQIGYEFVTTPNYTVWVFET